MTAFYTQVGDVFGRFIEGEKVAIEGAAILSSLLHGVALLEPPKVQGCSPKFDPAYITEVV